MIFSLRCVFFLNVHVQKKLKLMILGFILNFIQSNLEAKDGKNKAKN